MSTSQPTRVTKNFSDKSILVSREFAAPVARVWRAYTESVYLDQWWGPAPWRAATKSLNFVPGGYWLYAMVGPNGECHWGRMNYLAIDLHRSITIEDIFCDAHGEVDPLLPASRGTMIFAPTPLGTRVDLSMKYASEADLQKIVEMGFEQGITLCAEQLAALLSRVPA
jgi:uncharacterized protein YndB with AHSA1/START domain